MREATLVSRICFMGVHTCLLTSNCKLGCFCNILQSTCYYIVRLILRI